MSDIKVEVGDYLYCIKDYYYSNSNILIKVGEKCIVEECMYITIPSMVKVGSIYFSIHLLRRYFETVSEYRSKIIEDLL